MATLSHGWILIGADNMVAFDNEVTYLTTNQESIFGNMRSLRRLSLSSTAFE
jgi:hypothetical protein